MYDVRWERSALDELTAIWVDADSGLREAVTDSTHALDRELRSDPYRSSESRGQERRVLLVPPLGVYFRVDETQGVVSVLQVWCFRRRKT